MPEVDTTLHWGHIEHVQARTKRPKVLCPSTPRWLCSLPSLGAIHLLVTQYVLLGCRIFQIREPARAVISGISSYLNVNIHSILGTASFCHSCTHRAHSTDPVGACPVGGQPHRNKCKCKCNRNQQPATDEDRSRAERGVAAYNGASRALRLVDLDRQGSEWTWVKRVAIAQIPVRA